MSNLFSALQSSADALSVFQSALSVSQNNIANVSTPGYVKQTQMLEALPFSSSGGASGGVAAGPVESARDTYAEQTVQTAVTSLGTWEQQLGVLQPLQSSFDITGSSGIPGALNQLFQAASGWAAAPNDSTAQASVLNAAQTVSQAFQQQSAAVTQAVASADGQLGGLVSQVNALAGQIRQDNVARSQEGPGDPSLDANVYSTLEQLSEIVPITTLKASDGSTTVLLDGQTPLVLGQNQYQISSNVSVPTNPPPANPGGPPSAQVLDSNGNDITSNITTGQLGGLLHVRNVTLAQLQGDSSQQGSLNQLAQAVADTVNGLLTGGNISDANATTGTPAVPGIPLFTYAAGNPSSVAQTLSVNPNITPSQLAAIDPGPPEVDNGVALKIAALATPQNAADEINGMSYVGFYGDIAGGVGSAISTAQNNQTTAQSVATQARNLRQQSSGVDLNQEAVTVLQFQRSYDAAAKMVTVLDQLTQDVVNMIQ